MRVLASHGLVNRWLNPYNWLLNSHLERIGVTVVGAAPWRVMRGQGDILHLHWPENVIAVRSAARARLAIRSLGRVVREGRRQGVRLVWTVHNLRPHDGAHPALEAEFWRDFLAEVDGVIHLSDAGRRAAEARFPALADRPAWVIPHGHYREEYRMRHHRHAARRSLAIDRDAPTAAFIGRVRPYKNVPGLLDAFARLTGPSARLVISGQPSDVALRDAITERALRDARVRLDLRHLRRARLAQVVTAADVVVLPYREILNSGAALLALSLDRPVLVPNLGAMAELADAVGPAWVRCFDGDLTPAVLRDALAWGRETPRPARAPLGRFSWPSIARAHRDAFRTLTGVAEPAGVAADLPGRRGLRALAAAR